MSAHQVERPLVNRAKAFLDTRDEIRGVAFQPLPTRPPEHVVAPIRHQLWKSVAYGATLLFGGFVAGVIATLFSVAPR